MKKKKVGMALLLVPLTVIILVFVINTILGVRIQADPERISMEALFALRIAYGILGLISIVSALVGGYFFLSSNHKKTE